MPSYRSIPIAFSAGSTHSSGKIHLFAIIEAMDHMGNVRIVAITNNGTIIIIPTYCNGVSYPNSSFDVVLILFHLFKCFLVKFIYS